MPRRIVRFSFRLVATLVVVTALAAAILVFYAQRLAEHFRPEIAEYFSDSFGAEVSFESIRLSILPDLRLRLGQVRLKLPGDSRFSAIEAGTLIADVDLRSLLSDTIRIANFELRDAAVPGAELGAGAISVSNVVSESKNSEHKVRGELNVRDVACRSEKRSCGIKQVEGSFNLDLYAEGVRSAAGTVTIERLNYDHPKAKFRGSIGRLALTDFTHDATGGRFSATVSAADFELKDGSDTYGLTSANGPFESSSAAGGRKITSPVFAVSGFRYADGITNLRGTDMEIRKVDVTLKENGSVEARTQLQSSALLLDAPEISISKIGSVSAPIAVSIPAKGYRVSGPITASGLEFIGLGRQFKQTSGTVPITITGPLKQFEAKELSFNLNGRSGKLSGALSMTPGEYSIEQLATDYFGGSIAAGGRLARTEPRTFSASGKARDLELNVIAETIDPALKDTLGGEIASLDAEIRGALPDWRTTAAGKGSVVFAERLNRKLNLVERIFGALRVLGPFSSAKFDPDQAAAEDDQQRITLDFKIADGAVSTENLLIDRPRYNVTARGSAEFSGPIKGDGSVIFFEQTVKSAAFGLKPLEKLIGSAGRLTVPLDFSGTVSDPQVAVDKAEFLKIYSGLALGESVVRGIGSAGAAVINALPLPSRRSAESPSPTPN